MDMEQKKQIEKFEQDYNAIFSKQAWEPHDITMMKDLQKLMYYIEVRCAMKEGSEDNWDSNERSYRGQMRNPLNGQYMSRGGSGMYPMGGRYYDGGMSGRRYYDGGREDAISRMNHLMDTETNPEARMAIQMAIRELEAK